jgi:hypothetical protein
VSLTIDVHHHILPDIFWRATNDAHSPVGGISPAPWSKESTLSYMDLAIACRHEVETSAELNSEESRAVLANNALKLFPRLAARRTNPSPHARVTP